MNTNKNLSIVQQLINQAVLVGRFEKQLADNNRFMAETAAKMLPIEKRRLDELQDELETMIAA